MAARTNTENPLVVKGKAPDAPLNVQLHPLVLLSISEYITRHTIRQQPGPIFGAIIGQQNGRSFTLEHAFHCPHAENTDELLLQGDWFTQRLDMYKEVHKEPALDLVALFTIGPIDGPQPAHVPLVKQVQQLTSSDTLMLLLFHPDQVDDLQGGKLPISLYETIEESDGEHTNTRFRELNFEVETGDAERIGVDFVAKGGGHATAIPKADTAGSSSKDKKGKGKAKVKDDEADTIGPTGSSALSPEDDELVSSLTAKINAIKMLTERIDLIRNYLASLTESYLTDSSSTKMPSENTNFVLLRSINALMSRLPLLAPPASTNSMSPATGSESNPSNLELAGEKEQQDVHLTSLLAGLTRSIAEAQSMGTKFNIVQRDRTNRDRAPYGRGGSGRLLGGGEAVLTDVSGI